MRGGVQLHTNEARGSVQSYLRNNGRLWHVTQDSRWVERAIREGVRTSWQHTARQYLEIDRKESEVVGL